MAIQGIEIRPEVVDAGAQRSALTRGRLQEQSWAVRIELLEQRQQPLAHLVHRGLVAAVVDAGAGVDDDAPGADRGSAPEVVGDRSHREPVRLGSGTPDVDQVRRMDEGRDAVAFAGRPERRILGGIARRKRPAARVANEHLSSGATDPRQVGQRSGEAFDHPYVGADRVAYGRHGQKIVSVIVDPQRRVSPAAGSWPATRPNPA